MAYLENLLIAIRFAITRPVHLLTVSIPTADRLDIFDEDIGASDVVVELLTGGRSTSR
jgi:hypothetical protein